MSAVIKTSCKKGAVLERPNVSSLRGQISRDQKLVFTNGCFDILHVGHVRYLQEARALGDFLFVGINSDSSVKKIKGPSRPIQCAEDRAEILAGLSCVDYVCIFDEETPVQLISEVRPQILVKGGDWAVEKIAGSEFVKSYGGQVFSLPFVPGRSTTSILERSRS